MAVHNMTEATACDRCDRTSYSWTIWQWCPWCDTAHKPGPAPRDLVMS